MSFKSLPITDVAFTILGSLNTQSMESIVAIGPRPTKVKVENGKKDVSSSTAIYSSIVGVYFCLNHLASLE